MYGQENNYSRIYQLKQEIKQEKQGERKYVEYLGSLQRKKDELCSYRPQTADMAVIRKREEENDIFELLAGLNPSYEAIRAQIMNTIPLSSYLQIKNMIQQEESRREAMGGSQVTIDEGRENHSFAMAKRLNFPNLSQNSEKRGETKKYEHYKKEGHDKNNCSFLRPELRPKSWGNGGKGGKKKNPKGRENLLGRRRLRKRTKKGDLLLGLLIISLTGPPRLLGLPLLSVLLEH